MDLDAFFSQIETHYKNELPFVIYRKPNQKAINGFLQKGDKLFFTKDFKEKGFVFSPFDTAKNTVLIPLESSELIRISVDLPVQPEEVFPSEKNSASQISKDFHVALVKKGVDAINSSTLKKVVLSRSETVSLEAGKRNPISIFKSLLRSYTSTFVYCWFHPKVGLWLGATPETLVKIEGNAFSIMALAGTQNYKGSLEVVWKPKEIQEQQYVTDFILDHIKPFVENIKVSDKETVKAGNLLHIKTKISGLLKPGTISLKKMLYGLHPTPAVCGLPKEKAKQFILASEHYNREFYTGFLGELNLEASKAPRSGKRNIENRAYSLTKSSTQLYVNLRCMKIENKNAILYTGGGITKSSDAEREWEETVAKSFVMKRVL